MIYAIYNKLRNTAQSGK